MGKEARHMTITIRRPELQGMAETIRQAMEAKGYTHEALAKDLDLPDRDGASLGNWLRGKYYPSEKYQDKLIELLDLPPEVMVKPNRSMTRDEREREQDRAYRRRKREEAKMAQQSVNGEEHEGSPASRALAAYKAARSMPENAPKPAPRPSAVAAPLTCTLDMDGMMRITLDIRLPLRKAMALAQWLTEGDMLPEPDTQR
jgi:transcriptional regulator with XRE-family HTH domain